MFDRISQRIEHYTAKISNFETERNYISLSHVAHDEGEIIRMYKAGFEDTLQIRLRCYKGYQMEKDLVRRIMVCFGSIRHYWIRANASIQRQVYSKLKFVVDELHLHIVKAARLKEVSNG